MIIKRKPTSHIMKMKIRPEWLDFRVLFLLHDVFDDSLNFTIEEMPFRKTRDPEKIIGESLGDAIWYRFDMDYADSYDNAEIFTDREAVAKRINELSKQQDNPTSVILRTMLTMFRDKLQSHKDFR